MTDQDLKKLIKLERKKIKKHIYLGFSSEFGLDSNVQRLSKKSNSEVIDFHTNKQMTKEKILDVKSLLFGRNPKKFNELFPDEDDSHLYKYIKNYVQICKEDEEYRGRIVKVNKKGLEERNRILKERDEIDLKEDEGRDKLEKLCIKKILNDKDMKFIGGPFNSDLGVGNYGITPTYYFLKLKENTIELYSKTLSNYLLGHEKKSLNNSVEEIIEPIIFQVGTFDSENEFKYDTHYDIFDINEIVLELNESDYSYLSQPLLDFQKSGK
jgi:hypothetical protein